MAKEMTVIVLDDEPIVGDRLKPALEKEGFRVEVFTDSTQALARLEDHGYSLLITDMKMQGPSGMDVLRFVEEHHPGMQIIVITGYATIEASHEARAHGACHFIPKPFKMKELVDLAAKALRETS